MALAKWKSQHKALGLLCLLLIAASQVSRILPGSSILRISHSHQTFMHSSSFAKSDNALILTHGAPFIRESRFQFKPKVNALWKNSLPKAANHANAAVAGEQETTPTKLISQGYAGPFVSLMQQEVALLPKTIADWQRLKSNYAANLTHLGFGELSDASCYLWLAECFNLAKHSGILKHVKDVLGERVVVYGMRIWEAKAESEMNVELHYEGYSCDTVHIIAGSGIKLVKGSHLMDARMAVDVARRIPQLEGMFPSHQPQDQIKLLDAAVVSRINSHVRRNNAEMTYLDTGPYGVLILNGKAVYATINSAREQRISALIQFASADCKLRCPQLEATPIAKPLPPTLIVSGISSSMDTMNDQRHSLATEEVMVFLEEQASTDSSNVRSSISNITVFSGAGVAEIYSSTHGFSSKTYGVGFSPLLSKIKVDYFTSIGISPGSGNYISHANEVVVVVLDGLLMYHRTAKKLKGHKEVKELAMGSVTYLSRTLWHALLAALPGTSFITVSWAAKELSHSQNAVERSSVRHSIYRVGYLFEKPLTGLDALEGKRVVLQGGQAYDPANDIGSDVVVVVVKGLNLQVLPLQTYLEKSDVLLIPMGVPCVLWNTGRFPVIVVVLHFYQTSGVSDDMNSYLQEAAFKSGDRIMKL